MTHSWRRLGRLILFCLGSCLVLPTTGLAQKSAKGPTARKAEGRSKTLATVDGVPVTQQDLDRMFRVQQVPQDRRAAERPAMLEALIDRELIRKWLSEQGVVASGELVESHLQTLLQKGGGGDSAQVEAMLAKQGYPASVIREELEFRLAWRTFVESQGDGAGLKEYFQQHQEQFDGTEIHARQILRKVARDDAAGRDEAVRRLLELRAKIVAGDVAFAQAAREHSQAPTREAGGDVGWFQYRGKMPPEFTREAFALQAGEISQPLVTQFGVHLIEIVERRAGELTLEDVRETVLAAYSEALWQSTAAERRKTAVIERPTGGAGVRAGK